MRKIIALSATALGLSMALVPTAEAAAPSIFVDIVTTRVSAFGDVYVDTPTGETRVMKPTFKTDMNVRCPAGRAATLNVSPVLSMTSPVVGFTCTGRQQIVSFPRTGASDQFGWHYTTVGASLYLDDAPQTTRATDTQRVYVFTSRRDLYP